MTSESFFAKLNQNLEAAKETLRMQLSEKIKYLNEHLDKISTTELREELESLVDDFIMRFSSVYQEFISYIEAEIPVIPKPIKKRKKKLETPKKEVIKKEFVRPTYVHKELVDSGLRLAKDARPLLMDILNEKLQNDIEKIKEQLPTYQKGEKKGERKRITIKPEDLSKEKLLKISQEGVGKELDSIPIDVNGTNYELLISLRQILGNKKENIIE